MLSPLMSALNCTLVRPLSYIEGRPPHPSGIVTIINYVSVSHSLPCPPSTSRSLPYSSRISNVSLSLARSARSTPTRILDAFHNCTMLMMFLATHTGAVNTANNCGYVV